MSSASASPNSEPANEAEAAQKKKGGRPKKSATDRQEHGVMVRFSAARYAQLSAHARAGGQTVAGVIKAWMGTGPGVALTAEQHACVRHLPSINNRLDKVIDLLVQQPGQQYQAAELLAVQERLVELLTSFQR